MRCWPSLRSVVGARAYIPPLAALKGHTRRTLLTTMLDRKCKGHTAHTRFLDPSRFAASFAIPPASVLLNPSGFRKAPIRFSGLLHGPGEVSNRRQMYSPRYTNAGKCAALGPDPEPRSLGKSCRAKRCPIGIYTPSPRPYRDSALPQYPFHDRTVCVTRCGRICIGKRRINLNQVFSGQLVGIREVEEKIWLVSFLDFDLGYFDEKGGRVEPGPNPFEATVLTMSSA